MSPGGRVVGLKVVDKEQFAARNWVNRDFFDRGLESEGEEALYWWRQCLGAGDSMAHLALGYTHYELGIHQQVHGHLRHYADIAPHGSWVWCWLGKAAAAIGESGEARRAFKRAIELEEAGDDATDARDLLSELVGD